MYTQLILASSLILQAVNAVSVQEPLKQDATLNQPIKDDMYDLIAILKDAEIIPDVLHAAFLPQVNLKITYPATNSTSVSIGSTQNVSDLSTAPIVKLQALYGGKSLFTTPSQDNEEPATPSIWSKLNPFSSHKKGKHHHKHHKRHPQLTVIITDPDAPSRDDPQNREFCHWILTDLSLKPLKHFSDSENETQLGHHERKHKGKGKGKGKGKKHHHHKPTEVLPYYAPAPPPKTGKHRYVFLALAPVNGTLEKLHLEAPTERKWWGHQTQGAGVREWADEMGLAVVGANFFYAENEEQ